MSQSRGTLSVRVRGVPFAIEFADWTHDRLYHTVEFEGGDSNEISAFVNAAGAQIPGGGRTLTDVDTNIPRSGDNGVPEGWEMLIYSIQIEVVREMGRVTAANMFQLQDTFGSQLSRPTRVGGYDPGPAPQGGVLFDFLRKTYAKFNVNQKVQSEGPSVKYPSGPNISVFTTATDVEVATSSIPSPRDQLAFVLPIWLRPNIAYVMKLKPQAGLGAAGVAPAGVIEGYYDWTGLPATNLGFDVRVTLEGLLKRPVT